MKVIAVTPHLVDPGYGKNWLLVKEPRRLQRGRHRRVARDRGHGRGLPRGRLAPQRQQHHGCLAATLQVSAAIPNFLITEYFVNFEPRAREVMAAPFRVEDGYIAVPGAPGLGIELDEAALARHAYRESPARAMPTPADEGP